MTAHFTTFFRSIRTTILSIIMVMITCSFVMGNSDEEAVKALMDNYLKAYNDKDWDRINEILSYDYKAFSDNAQIIDRAEYISTLKGGNWVIEELKMENLQIWVSKDGKMAVATVKSTITGKMKEQKAQVISLETSIFKKYGKTWKYWHSHISSKSNALVK